MITMHCWLDKYTRVLNIIQIDNLYYLVKNLLISDRKFGRSIIELLKCEIIDTNCVPRKIYRKNCRIMNMIAYSAILRCKR